MTILRKFVLTVLAACLWAPVAGAEEPGLFERLELRNHAKLAEVRKGAELAPFTTDGCSGGMSATWSLVARMFPDFEDIHLETPPWQGCCVTHDRAYHLGNADPAPEASFAARLAADEALAACVTAVAEDRRAVLQSEYGMSDAQIDMAYRLIGSAMYDAVRFGGGPCSGLPWRWGYGWPQCLLE
ncbi:hypothetical protein [Shimia sp. SDUM112013]|uniref:hypothetical protein n=1 Tax=Shimia sp. SDUM112013 TaxID=3136160 RepID=UPI0032EA9B74